MKTTRTMWFLALVAAACLLAPGAAQATLGSNCAGCTGSPFDPFLTPNAKGIMVPGTIDMEWIGPVGSGSCGAQYDLHYTMRVNFKKSIYTFSDIVGALCLTDVETAVNDINGNVNSVVVPALGLSGTAVLKSVTNVADPPLFGDNNPSNMIWLMLDFEYAVK